MKQRKLALTMRGGGARCLIYLGFLRLLEEEDIEVDYIIGSSAGAIIAGGYAMGHPVIRIKEVLQKIKFIQQYIDFQAIRNLDVADQLKTEEHLRVELGEHDFLECKRKFWAQVTNFTTQTPELIGTGSMTKAMVASMAFPFICDPVEINGNLYGDGDLSGGPEANFLRSQGAEVVIGLNLDESQVTSHTVMSLSIAEPFQIMRKTIIKLYQQLDPVDISLSFPPNDIDWVLGFSKADEYSDLGYEVSKLILPEIRELLFSRKIYFMKSAKKLLKKSQLRQ